MCLKAQLKVACILKWIKCSGLKFLEWYEEWRESMYPVQRILDFLVCTWKWHVNPCLHCSNDTAVSVASPLGESCFVVALFSLFSVACSIVKIQCLRLRHSCSKLACVGGRTAMVHQFGCKSEVEGNWHSVEITRIQFLQFLLIYYHVVQPNNIHASCLAEDRL